MLAGGSGITPMFQVCMEIIFCCILVHFLDMVLSSFRRFWC
jgi:hypothetical protein